jgi:hypothetical protein
MEDHMAIEDNVKKVLAEGEKERKENANFESLREFYEQAKREGFAIKHEYTLPQFDSIGRRFYEVQTASKREEQ